MKRIAVIGSTGSIGKNALEIIAENPGQFSVSVLAAKNNVEVLLGQAKKYRPGIVAIFDENRKKDLVQGLASSGLSTTRVVSGREGLSEAVISRGVDQVLLALTGAEGLAPLVAAIRAGKDIALANKEPLVMAGELIRSLVNEHRVSLLPIDSEHSGIFQCIDGRLPDEISRVFLTASGGPFLDRDLASFDRITAEEAIRHPRWNMGRKISVDSATLMNKGLEVIEASVLFGLKLEQIEVLIHPEAILHAIVEFVDGSQLAQLSVTDMKLPIQYALSYPLRLKTEGRRLSLAQLGALHFRTVDCEKFPCLGLAYQAAREGGLAPCVLNAANEVCVEAFLKGEIPFTEIPKLIRAVLSGHHKVSYPNLEDILKSDSWARIRTRDLIQPKMKAGIPS